LFTLNLQQLISSPGFPTLVPVLVEVFVSPYLLSNLGDKSLSCDFISLMTLRKVVAFSGFYLLDLSGDLQSFFFITTPTFAAVWISLVVVCVCVCVSKSAVEKFCHI
jgi:hypothetical protein